MTHLSEQCEPPIVVAFTHHCPQYGHGVQCGRSGHYHGHVPSFHCTRRQRTADRQGQCLDRRQKQRRGWQGCHVSVCVRLMLGSAHLLMIPSRSMSVSNSALSWASPSGFSSLPPDTRLQSVSQMNCRRNQQPLLWGILLRLDMRVLMKLTGN